MKLAGKKPTICSDFIAFPRQEGDLIFKARGLTSSDYDEFRKLCPEPKPDLVTTRDGSKSFALTDPEYIKKMKEFGSRKWDYMYLKSLSVTADLDWETVKMEDPTTWGNFRAELAECLTTPEFNLVMNLVLEVNGLDDKKIEEAKKRFMSPPEKVADSN